MGGEGMKNKILATALAALVACGLGFGASAPAYAHPGNTVRNNSVGWVNVIKDNGTSVWLAGFSSSTTGVKWVRVWQGSCVQVGLTRNCAPYGSYDVILPWRAAVVTVARIS
jgi:hypothetical protein